MASARRVHLYAHLHALPGVDLERRILGHQQIPPVILSLVRRALHVDPVVIGAEARIRGSGALTTSLLEARDEELIAIGTHAFESRVSLRVTAGRIVTADVPARVVRDIAEILYVVAQVQEIVVGRELTIECAAAAVRYQPDRLDAPTRRRVIGGGADAAGAASREAG